MRGGGGGNWGEKVLLVWVSLFPSSPRGWCKFKLQWRVVVAGNVSDCTHGNARVAPRGMLFLA